MTAEMLADQLWGLAAAANVRIGFESIEPTNMRSPLRRAPMPMVITPISAALDATLAADDRYEWRAIEEIVVVRPKDAWTDPADPLNRQMHNVQVRNVHPVAVFGGLKDFLYTGRFAVNPKGLSGDVSFHVTSGTVLDVLNQLVTASDQAMWVAYYRRSATDETSLGDSLRLDLRNTKRRTSLLVGPRLVPTFR